MGMKT